MPLRKPLVVVTGNIKELPVADYIATVGTQYNLVGITKLVPALYQYLIAGRLLIDASSILRVDGQVVII